MAKKYHPDFNTEGDIEKSTEIFKKINKAYEVLANPISRQTYDIENRINDGQTTQDQSVYQDEFTGKTYYQPRTITDFYHTKWTGYKKPDWYHPYNGQDVRSEYLYRKKLHDKYWYIPPWVDIVVEFVELNRFFFYLMLFFAGDLIRLYFDYRDKKVQQMEMQLLQDSFSLDSEDSQRQSLMSLVSSINIDDENDEDAIRLPEDKERQEMLKQALNDYINERVSAISKMKQDQEQSNQDDVGSENTNSINLGINIQPAAAI
ncbi:UNKNOWN [Stylonychia lemnae]|uniref:J domain-containing protein n=1 Tax=Stylonychia lemnae TaxID=5949 RepID=A0A077ZZW9_STYLE|nr:UNKNOWN [Stylonychia lemnae]|eukprot:CDW75445.1 UNKNOWN [Stylonychia lemnae]